MAKIETEKDIERLRKMAVVLHKENEILHRRLQRLTVELALARGEDRCQLELELKLLKERLDRQNRTMFGSSSEKRPRRDQDERAKTDEQRAAPTRAGHGPRKQPELPVVERVHELDEPDKLCPQCGGDLSPMTGQFEEAEEIDIVEREFRIVRHKRQKYTCTCGGCVDTALGPRKLIPGGRFSVDFAVAVAVAKYADHLPLARQVKQMKRQGLTTASQTLWDQLWALHTVLLPSYDALPSHVLANSVIGADETTWPLMETGKTTKWWSWTITCSDAVYHHILESRSHEAAAVVLGDFGGVVVADGYSAYTALRGERLRRQQQPMLARKANGAEMPPVFSLANCWAHARRRFVDCETHYPQVREVVDLIGELYEIEATARQGAAETLTTRLAQLRREKSAPLLDKIRTWTSEQRAVPRTSFANALKYLEDRWEGLSRFAGDPSIPIDNNHTERQMRGHALGRKNHYGSKSKRGIRVAALFYSLIESAALAGLEPAAYLAEATRRALDNPGTATLPAVLVKERAAAEH